MHRPAAFVGRVAELAALEEALAAAILGRGGAVLLEGEPGIGKTRLAAELGDRAARRGARVLWSRCAVEAEAPPYWPFVQLLRPLYADSDPGSVVSRFGPGASDVLALLSEPSSARTQTSVERPAAAVAAQTPAVSADPQRFRFFDAVTSMLTAAAADRPLVLVFDDLHAADPGCLALVVFLVRALRTHRVLVVATLRRAESRRTDVAPIVGSLAREALSLPVEGWTLEEVGAFLGEGRGGRAGDAVVEAVHRASAGNPFFVGEIAQILRSPARSDAAAAIPIPPHVRQAVLARIEPLPAASIAALEAGAVAGLSFDAAVAAAIAGTDAHSLREALSVAVEAGFVEAAGAGSWSFRHEIAREVLYENVPAAARRRGHLAAAHWLERSERNVEAAAHHRLAALPDGDVGAAVAGVLAAAVAASSALAFERASSWLRRGLDALAGSGARDGEASAALRCRLLLTLGDALWSAGDLAGSREAFDEAAALAERAGEERMTLLARAALGLGGRQQRAHVQLDARVLATLERAIGAVGDSDVALRASLLARRAYALYAARGSRAERETLCAEADALARRSGDRSALRSVLVDRRWALWGPDRLDERRAITEELLDAARRSGDREAALVEHGWRFVTALETGDRTAADEAFAAYRGGAAELRLPWYDWYATRFACLLAQVEGRLDDAERLAGGALAAGERAGHPDASLVFGTQILGIRLAQDRGDEIEGAIEMSVAQYPDVTLWRRLLARLRIAQQRGAEAAGELERARAGALVEAPGDFLHLPSLAMLSDLVLAGGDADLARRTRVALEPYSGRQIVLGFGLAWLGPVDQRLGELAAARGDEREAQQLLERAEQQSVALGAVRWAAAARAALRGLASPRAGAGAAAATGAATRAVLAADGAGWRGEFAGAPFRTGALRGVVYLRALLEAPERELHVLELAALGDPAGAARGRGGGHAIADRADRSTSGPLLDDRAKRAYRMRLAELRADLDEAIEFSDDGRIAAARAEIEALEDELARAVGLGGRARQGGDAAERARVAVAKRIRAALDRIGEQSPELQRYLEATVRTGIFCVYRPDPGRPVEWEL